MAQCKVQFVPIGKSVTVEAGTTLLEAAGMAGIAIDSVCGGHGLCGRCKMIVRDASRIGGDADGPLTDDEIRRGVVLACKRTVEGDLHVEIPEETRARDRIVLDKDAHRFKAVHPGIEGIEFESSPVVSKLFLKLAPPTIENNLADCERIQRHVEKAAGLNEPFSRFDRLAAPSKVEGQIGIELARRAPEILRANGFAVTATVTASRCPGLAEILDLEGGDTSAKNAMAVVDVGTSTIVVHLVDAVRMTTIGTEACFNSQATYGREVTARMISAEKRESQDELQRLVAGDINQLIADLAAKNNVRLEDITAVVCAGNTAMMHFLLGLSARNIRRSPFVAVTVEPPALCAAKAGIRINPRGLLFIVPGIGGWVGGDITAGILATGLHEMDGVGMLIDVGTNGEIVLGNKDWLVACSASAGPALEGAGVECGMMAQEGAIEEVHVEKGEIQYDVIGDAAIRPDGICGSGVIDLIAVLLEKGVINRSGKLIPGSHPSVRAEAGSRTRFVLARKEESLRGNEIAVFQEDIDNVITAKAAIFAAARIMLERLDLRFSDIDKLFIAGGFGNYISPQNAIAIGLFPDLPLSKIFYAGNTSVWGAKLAAFSGEARRTLREISNRTTNYELIGTGDYVEQFKQAMFLPHTNIELFPSCLRGENR